MKTLIALLFVFVGCAQAQVRNVSPHFYYRNFFVAPDGNGRGKYETPEEAYAVSKAYFDANYAPGWYATDMFPDFNMGTVNGLPNQYDMHYVRPDRSTSLDDWFPAVLIDFECGQGMLLSGSVTGLPAPYHWTYICTPDPKPEPCDCPALGKPIYPATGIEKFTETDYTGSGANALRFSRTYRSDRNQWINNYQVVGIDFTAPTQAINSNLIYAGCFPGIGANTLKPYCFPFVSTGLANDFFIQRGNGRMLNFGSATDLLPTTADINDRLTKVTGTNGATIGWNVYRAADDATERYDLTGRLQTSTARNGRVQTFTYSTASTPLAIAPRAGLLIRVTDQFGAQLNLAYDSAARLVKLTDPAGGVTSYAYDEASSIVLSGNSPANNLTSVTYPDGKKRMYWYNEQDKTAGANLPTALTGITDENGVRHATIKYDAYGKAISTELADGNQRYDVAYPQPSVKTTVTDPLGTIRTYNFQTLLGVVRFIGVTQPNGSGGSASTAITYDANGNVASFSDLNGNVTTYRYDLTRNLETSRTEAAGTPQARTVSTQWHATYRLPIKIAEPNRITTLTYDTAGNLLTRGEQATTDATGTTAFTATPTGSARVTTYTYNSLGQVLTMIGPRTDVVDRTTYTYDTQGNLATLTNSLGQVTSFNQYDVHGRVLKLTDPNGVITTLIYNPRGWLTSQTISSGTSAETTRYQYDAVGQLTTVTLPDNSAISYSYDAAHHLIKIADGLGNRIDYTLDALGNQINEQVKDASGNLARQSTRVIDALNRLQQQTGEQ